MSPDAKKLEIHRPDHPHHSPTGGLKVWKKYAEVSPT
jgi:hypothetical protein